ncbi:MAG: AAA family ATPase [Cyclobacteriaceae bacterium]|nr:AAA family ATPase [Cyclobacteriaceae bacterium]
MDSNENKNQPGKYKFRSIKVHSSDEWMADATKKYRKVYDRYETTYIRVEFSVFNKLFDEAEWEANVRLKCFFVNGTHRRELCNLEQKRVIGKDENIVYFRDSWGQSTYGTFWLKGVYVWEGYIDEVKVGETTFYVEDVGAARKGENLFFDIESIKLFEGDGKASTQENKRYLKTFSQKETRYVWSDFRFKNKVHSDYYTELFFNFYDKAGLLKGSSSYITYVAANTLGQTYTLFPGWGGETPGRWSSDAYTMEVVFMDNLIATIPFRVADEAEEGDAPILTNGIQLAVGNATQATTGSAPATKNAEDLLFESLAELNSLTGLTKIKQEVNEMVKLVKFYQETGKDFLNKFSLHTVFTGNPGTGKTTVARILAKVYKGLGILEKGHLVEVDREGLVAGYVGQTALKTGEKINEAMGGILFIDEAYSLAHGKGSQYDFGGEAIQIILKRMEDNRGKFGVIVAGYTENMHQFIESNPGLKSRFDMYFEFPDYSPEEMNTIAHGLFKKEGVIVEEAARKHLQDYFTFLHSERDQHFGNARSVRQVVGESVKNQHLRLASMKKEERTPELMETIILDDVREFEIKPGKSKRPSIGFQTGNS